MIRGICLMQCILMVFLLATGGLAHASKMQSLTAFAKGKKTLTKATLLNLLVKQKLTRKEAQSLEANHAQRLRNTMYALQGAKFKSLKLRTFFTKQKWYKASKKPSDISLGAIAKENVRRLLTTQLVKEQTELDYENYPLRAHYVGNKRKDVCLRFRSYDVIIKGSYYHIQKKAKACRFRSSLRVSKISSSITMSGFAKNFIMERMVGHSDLVHLKVYNVLTNKVVFEREYMSAQSYVSLDANGYLIYWGDGIDPKLDKATPPPKKDKATPPPKKRKATPPPKKRKTTPLPKKCKNSPAWHKNTAIRFGRYNAWLKKCWSHMQKADPRIKHLKRPVCAGSGQHIYLMFRRKRDLSKPESTPPKVIGVACHSQF